MFIAKCRITKLQKTDEKCHWRPTSHERFIFSQPTRNRADPHAVFSVFRHATTMGFVYTYDIYVSYEAEKLTYVRHFFFQAGSKQLACHADFARTKTKRTFWLLAPSLAGPRAFPVSRPAGGCNTLEATSRSLSPPLFLPVSYRGRAEEERTAAETTKTTAKPF